MKKQIIQAVCQWYADMIIKCIEHSFSPEFADQWIRQGQWLDAYCVEIHDIYLK